METEGGSGTGAARGPQVRLGPVWVESTAAAGGASELEQGDDLIGWSAAMLQTARTGQSGGVHFGL